jgi:hypothetical protein
MPAGTDSEITSMLEACDALLERTRSSDVCAEAARLLADGAVVGWIQGRSEFGPRALGNRSILADPRPEENRVRVNGVVKKREGYRPFAPSVLCEEAHRFFDIPESAPELSYMVFTVNVRPEYRDLLGAVTHVDGTARIQTVDRETNEKYWTLIAEFGRITGVPVLLNTSFNNFAEPIVQTSRDAIECFLTTKLDYLVIDDWVVRKRPVKWSAYLDLVPALRPAARLRAVHRMNGNGQAPTRQHGVYFAYTKGSSSDISLELFEVLAAADGERTLRDLGVTADECGKAILDEALRLWEERFLTMTPAGAC